MHTELKLGNLENIHTMLSSMPLRVEDDYLIYGDDTQEREDYAKTVAIWDRTTHPEDFRQALLNHQLRSSTLNLSIWTNIYGYACGSHRHANISGGRAAMTARYSTFEDCVRLAYEKYQDNHNTVLRISKKQYEVLQDA